MFKYRAQYKEIQEATFWDNLYTFIAFCIIVGCLLFGDYLVRFWNQLF